MPPEAELEAAARLVPVALNDSNYASGSSGPKGEFARSMPYVAFLAFAKGRGIGRAAAEGAIRWLAEQRLLRVVQPSIYAMMDAEWRRKWLYEFQRRVFGERTTGVETWDLAEDSRILVIVSTVGLWEWIRERTVSVKARQAEAQVVRDLRANNHPWKDVVVEMNKQFPRPGKRWTKDACRGLIRHR
jgi:hypothetical protein